MESQKDTLKVYKHHQHARVQKEGDDMWISSEDLRTEGSSDEEAQSGGGVRGRRTKKNRKQRKTRLPESTKSTSSLASTSTLSTESYVKNVGAFTSEVDKPALDVGASQRFSTLDDPFYVDVFPDSTASTSGISLGSRDSGMDALNLESRWRPKRGSLKYPILVEGQTTANYLHEMDGFFSEMMLKIKSLRSCPALDNFELKGVEQEEPKLFKYLKNTPAVKEKLKYIERLDDEIKETIRVYKAERAERLQVQDEMCSEICKNNRFPERDTRMFLELCHFEVGGENSNDEQTKEYTETSEVFNGQQKNKNIIGDFIKRNIELARQGSMAGCSLTDEEKAKLEKLLLDESDDSYSLEDDPTTKPLGSSWNESDDASDDENHFISNAYSMNDDDKRRLENINSELEKFVLDETEQEKIERKESTKRRQVEWKDTVLMEQRLKAINGKLEELQEDEQEENVEEIFFGALDSDSDRTEVENEF